jgi:hypothetical protein
MRLFIYGSRFALLSVALLGFLGCSESNESIVDEQAKKTAAEKVEGIGPQPKDQSEYGRQSLQNNPLNKGYGKAGTPKK